MSTLEIAQPYVENMLTEMHLSSTLPKEHSHSMRSLSEYLKEMPVKNVKEKSSSLLQIVQIESMHPGDAYFGKYNPGTIGVFKKNKTVIQHGWSAGWFMPIDIVINPQIKPIPLIGIRIKIIKNLSGKELLFWQKVLDQRSFQYKQESVFSIPNDGSLSGSTPSKE